MASAAVMGWVPGPILTREARSAYVRFSLRLAEIYLPFVRHPALPKPVEVTESRNG